MTDDCMHRNQHKKQKGIKKKFNNFESDQHYSTLSLFWATDTQIHGVAAYAKMISYPSNHFTKHLYWENKKNMLAKDTHNFGTKTYQPVITVIQQL